jgi:hypothetical protein
MQSRFGPWNSDRRRLQKTERDSAARDVAGGQAPYRRKDFLSRPDVEDGKKLPVPDRRGTALGHLG